MKPLSSKTLEKKYAELGLSAEETDLLHKYFHCFANLYGVISVRDAWDVFRHYEGIGTIRRKDFATFSGIVQREAGHPYSILELKEAYCAEASDSPLDRLIVNNRLIGHGYGKYTLLYNTVDLQNRSLSEYGRHIAAVWICSSVRGLISGRQTFGILALRQGLLLMSSLSTACCMAARRTMCT